MMPEEIAVVTTRVEFLDCLKKQAVCAEIGVFLGQFTAQIVPHTEPKALHLVDPWTPTDWGAYPGLHSEVWDGIYGGIVKAYADDPRVKVHREKSHEALTKCPAGMFDWVYIDGDHRYLEVLQDIHDAYRVVRPGGWICGHDLQLPGVRRAVCDVLNSGVCKMRLMDRQTFTSWGMVRL